MWINSFQGRRVYVLCGKEALGPPPDPLRIANLSGALGNLENAMKSSLSTTYFITKDMKVDLHAQNLNGVLPILYTCIARADKSITNARSGRSTAAAYLKKPGRAEKAVALPQCVFVTPTTNPAVRRRYIISPPIFLTAASKRLPVS